MKAIFDLEKMECVLEEDQSENPFSMIINFCFTKNGEKNISFDNLSFGFSLLENKKKIIEETFPKEGLFYESTDQEILETSAVENIFPDIQYKLNLWSINSNNKIQAEFIVVRPKPQKPIFDSWIYDEKTYSWNPPIPWPDSETPGIAKWDEENLQWVFVDSVEEL